MAIYAYLYDATSTDREITLDAQVVKDLHDQQLLWVDVSEFEESEIRYLAELFALTRESVYNLLQQEYRPRLDNYGKYFQFNINAVEAGGGKYGLVQIDFILGHNIVLTIHRQPIAFLQSFDRRIKGDSDLGQLDAPSFLASLLDWHITSFFRIIEDLEAEVDRIDAHAIRPRHQRDLLLEMAQLRQRVGFIRRVLTPHREVYAALVRPDFQVLARSGSEAHYQMLNDRLERAIEGAENARELLVGSFDMFTTQTALRTNETMKVLTLVSAVLLPATVIIGIGSLLLKSPVYPIGPKGFWLMLALIGLIGLITIVVARWRRWI